MHTISGYLSVQGTKEDSVLAVSRQPSRGPYASFTSLIAVASGKTSGYVRVITADKEAADWPFWMRITVLESKKCTAASTPHKFHQVAVSQLHALQKVDHSHQICPRCC